MSAVVFFSRRIFRRLRSRIYIYIYTNENFIETTKKFFTFDVSTSIRGLHQKKLVLGLLLSVLGAIS